jgi:hypothetical protein
MFQKKSKHFQKEKKYFIAYGQILKFFLAYFSLKKQKKKTKIASFSCLKKKMDIVTSL